MDLLLPALPGLTGEPDRARDHDLALDPPQRPDGRDRQEPRRKGRYPPELEVLPSGGGLRELPGQTDLDQLRRAVRADGRTGLESLLRSVRRLARGRSLALRA